MLFVFFSLRSSLSWDKFNFFADFFAPGAFLLSCAIFIEFRKIFAKFNGKPLQNQSTRTSSLYWVGGGSKRWKPEESVAFQARIGCSQSFQAVYAMAETVLQSLGSFGDIS